MLHGTGMHANEESAPRRGAILPLAQCSTLRDSIRPRILLCVSISQTPQYPSIPTFTAPSDPPHATPLYTRKRSFQPYWHRPRHKRRPGPSAVQPNTAQHSIIAMALPALYPGTPAARTRSTPAASSLNAFSRSRLPACWTAHLARNNAIYIIIAACKIWSQWPMP